MGEVARVAEFHIKRGPRQGVEGPHQVKAVAADRQAIPLDPVSVMANKTLVHQQTFTQTLAWAIVPSPDGRGRSVFAIVPAWVVSAAAEAFTSAVVAATKHKPVHRDARLDDGWRFVLAVLGLALIVLGIDLWVSPPSHKAFAPSATMKGAIGNVETPSDTLSGVLLGLGAVLVLAAANGVKVASVKFGDTEVDWMDIAAAKAKDAGTTAKAKAIAAGLSVERQAEASVSAATLAYERASQEIRGIDPEAIAAEAVEAVRHQT